MQSKIGKYLTIKILRVLFLLTSLALTSCSQYKSSWSCPNPEGIGCSSITYADRLARKHIILAETNACAEQLSCSTKSKQTRNNTKPKVLLKERYTDFEYHEASELDIN